MGKHRVTATVYDRRGRVLATGENSYNKTHPVMHHYCKRAGEHPNKVYLHAEVAAIIRAGRHSEQPYKIHIARYDKRGRPALAAPCPICRLAINMAGIKEVSYTTGA
jgi:deoxycytidylate deaminase